MSEISTGLRSVLSNSSVYEALQNLLGANKARKHFIDKYIRPKPDDRILDIGCGPASLLPYLPAGAAYVGYDPSENYIATAKAKFGDRGQFYADIYTEDELHKHEPFNVVILSAVLHHLSDDEAKTLFGLLRRALVHGGKVVSIDPCFVDDQNLIAHKLIEMDRGQNVRRPEFYAALARPFFGYVSGEVTNLSWFPYNHWVMESAA